MKFRALSLSLAFHSIFFLLLLALPMHAQPAEEDLSPHSEATLVAETTAIQAGVPFTVALRMQMEEKWHSYWINPGDSGLATKITWDLPQGFTAGEIQWPHPERIDTPPLMTYGFEDELWLLTEITPPANLEAGTTVTLNAHAEWLICADICLPAEAQLSLQLPVTDKTPAVNEKAEAGFEKTRAQLPVAAEKLGYSFGAEPASPTNPQAGYVLRFKTPANASLTPDKLEGTYFFVGKESVLDHAAPQILTRQGDEFRIALTPSEYSEEAAKRLHGVLVAPEGQSWDADGEVTALAVDVPVGEVGAPLPSVNEASAPAATAGGTGIGDNAPPTLGLALLLAFGGGLLLNLMPCVFPVLSLKVLSFVQKAGEDKKKIARHGLVFGAGVIISFWALAGVLLALRATGVGIGWGYQLQSPLFVAALALLLFAVGLNLLGAFEIGASLTRLGSTPARGGYGGSFASGVLATVVATPCTAPFMGVALGYALTQSPAVALSVFTALGIGMATPYMLLSLNPSWLRRLPRAGGWMDTLKQFLAFPMFATALWLVWVFGLQTSVDSLIWLLGAFLLLGFAAWISAHWSHAASQGARLLARTMAAAMLLLALLVAWRGASDSSAESVTQASEIETASNSEWQPFSAEKISELRAAGTPVFVDFTAAWCITCQVNKKTTLSQPEVLQAFKERGVTLMRADWTRRDPEITQALQSFGRSGVPVYALYTPDGNSLNEEELPTFLPELLSEPIVLNALESIPVLSADSSESPSRQASR